MAFLLCVPIKLTEKEKLLANVDLDLFISIVFFLNVPSVSFTAVIEKEWRSFFNSI